MRRPLRAILLWLALQLLLTQQLALAHRLEHLADRLAGLAGVAVQLAERHGEGESAMHLHSHVCTVCIACFGCDAGATATRTPAAALLRESLPACSAVSPAPTLAFVAAYRSRAPPLLRN